MRQLAEFPAMLAGAAATYYLARAGAEVLLVERADLNGQAFAVTLIDDIEGAHGMATHQRIVHEVSGLDTVVRQRCL